MSEANVEIVRRWCELYNARDFDGLIALNSEDFEMRSVFAGVESGGIFRGAAGFPYKYFETIDDAYERFHLAATDFIDAGAAVVMVAEIEWRGRGSGAEGRDPLSAVFWLRSGRVFREESFKERDEAMAAAGLSE